MTLPSLWPKQRCGRPHHKPAGPDNIPKGLLKDCTQQLLELLFSLASVPTCSSPPLFSLPKCFIVAGLNDYQSMALASVVTACVLRVYSWHEWRTLSTSLWTLISMTTGGTDPQPHLYNQWSTQPSPILTLQRCHNRRSWKVNWLFSVFCNTPK